MYLIFLLIINIIAVLAFLFFNKYISQKLRLIDRASNNKILIHKHDTPNTGGVILFLFITIFYILNILNVEQYEFEIPLIFFTLFFILGLFDDYLIIKPLFKTLIYLIIILVFLNINTNLIINNFYVETFNAILYPKSISLVFTIFCIFFMLNILNMFDGINGSLISITLPFFIVIFLITNNSFYLFIILTLVVILIYNLKGKLFLGNNGASLITSIISFALIYESKNFPQLLSAEKIFLLFSIPSFDLCRLFYIRIKKGHNPLVGDLNHFHHIVLRKYKKKFWVSMIISLICIMYYFSLFISTVFLILFTLFIYSLLIIFNQKKIKNNL